MSRGDGCRGRGRARGLRHAARRPTTGWSAPTPATTSTSGSRPGACGCPARPGPAPARRRLRHRRVHRGAAGGGSAGARSSPSTPPAQMLARGPGQALAGHGPLRPHPGRGPGRGRGARPVRRHPRRLPDAQPRRPRRPAAAACATCCAPAAARGARVLGPRLAAGPGHVERGVLERDHPARPGRHRRRDPLPPPAPQRARLRRGRRVPRAGCARPGFTDVHSETMPGWQRDIVHTFLATRPA